MFGPGDVRFFDRIAPVFDRLTPAVDPARLAAGLDRASRPVERVVDLAGGSGRAAASVDASERLVVDAALGLLRRAPGRDARLVPVAGDARRLPLADESVDAVTVVDAFHHLPDQRSVAGEVLRVLRSGGVLVVVDVDPEHPLGRAVVAVEGLIGFGSIFTGPDDLARFLRRAGFADVAVVERGFTYTVVAAKGESN